MKASNWIQFHVTALLLLCCVSVCIATANAAQPFPAKGTYDFYILGEHAGTNTFTSVAKNTHVLISSHTSLRYGDYALELDSKTLFDDDSLRVIEFSYTGKERDFTTMKGAVQMKGDSVFGSTTKGDATFPSSRRIAGRNTVFFESYVAEHEILLARHFLATGKDFNNVLVFYPSDFMITPATMTLESEIELETDKGPVLCTKIAVYLEGGSIFYSYVNRATNVPIYLDFPAVNTEIFSREYFEKEVHPKYFKQE